MKGTKFFGIGIALAACVLILLLDAEAGFISVAWAGKPPKYHTEYGYAKLRDDIGDVVKSDDGRQFIDKHIAGGEDQVEFLIYDATNALYQSDTFMGEVENQSTRKANFFFDFNDAVTKPGEDQAVYDILVWTDGTRSLRRGNLVGSKYYLNDGTVHFKVTIAETREQGVFKGLVPFVIDPGWDGTAQSAITQTTVNNFYDGDQDVIYKTNTLGHIIYYLDYDNGFTIEGGYPTWTFTPNSGPVRLTVVKGKKVGFVVTLATYEALPFKLTVNSLALPAPRKHNTLSTTWGEVRSGEVITFCLFPRDDG
jgi:hypothetical protein